MPSKMAPKRTISLQATAGGDGKKAAEALFREANRVRSILRNVLNEDLMRLFKQEREFIKKYGTPEEYRRRMQDEMGLR